MNTKVVHLLTKDLQEKHNISSFQISDGCLTIEGVFSLKDIQEIVEIMKGNQATHSKEISLDKLVKRQSNFYFPFA